jgi:hypothetical protein
MSARLISRNADLKRLQDEGYEVEVRSGLLLLRSIPYVNARREVARGALVTSLTLNGESTQRPDDHQVWFTGELPCNRDGSHLKGINVRAGKQSLCPGVDVDFQFSSKPSGGYADYHAKMSAYADILSHQARAIDPEATARTCRPIPATEEESIFLYTDSASSRAGIAAVSAKLAMRRVAIIGLGGTGAYVLDQTAKTAVQEIHLFDGDLFLQHNAFRAPGAASLETLLSKPFKVDYYTRIYGQMRRGIVPHAEFINDATVAQLKDFEFVFVCVDKPAVRRLVAEFLIARGVPFIDAGMELELIREEGTIIGTARATLVEPGRSDHFFRHVSTEESVVDDLYKSNIQVADMNALNAMMAVIKWKKFCGFYQDIYKERQSAYALNAHQLTRDETDAS